MTKPYCIGSDEWNGASKVMEEMNELGEVFAKLIGSEGNYNHWTGDLREKLVEEIADVQAAIEFFLNKDTNLTHDQKRRLINRKEMKFRTFLRWDEETRENAK